MRAEGYIAKLTKLGKKVAVCDQVSDPKAPGIVEREVTRIVTPGTTMDESVLEQKANNFVLSLMLDDGFHLSYADVTTGEFASLTVASEKELRAEIERLAPSEIIVSDIEHPIITRLKNALPEVFFFLHNFSTTDAAAFLMDYLKTTQKTSLDHMKVAAYDLNDFMPLDEATLKNLELMATLREGNKEGSLLWVLDRTLTSMGGRMLRSFITHPLVHHEPIQKRLDAVEELVNERRVQEDLQECLKLVMDLERLLSRLSMGRGNARDVVGLKESLQQVPQIQKLLQPVQSSLLVEVRDTIDPLHDLVSLVEQALVAEPPINMSDGGIIADGYNTELDELKAISREGKRYMQNLQQEEVQKTGITNLKIRYNKVFGYYLEVSKGQVSKVPEEWIRKQTLVNAERYITPELKAFEEKVLGAEEKIVALEQKIFADIREKVVAEMERIQRTAKKFGAFGCIAIVCDCCFGEELLQNR